MGWLDAHESYVMEIFARDRMVELRSTVEMTRPNIEHRTAAAEVLPDTRHGASAALCPLALAKASR